MDQHAELHAPSPFHGAVASPLDADPLFDVLDALPAGAANQLRVPPPWEEGSLGVAFAPPPPFVNQGVSRPIDFARRRAGNGHRFVPPHPGSDSSVHARVRNTNSPSPARHAAAAAANGSDTGSSRTVSETFSDMLDKSVLEIPFVLITLVVYSLVISFSLGARRDEMSLTSGRPLNGEDHKFIVGPYLWKSTSALTLSITVFTFFSVTCFHLYIIAHLMMKRPPVAPRMNKCCAAYVSMCFDLSTICYFLHYVRLGRYGVDTKELIVLSVFTTLVLGGSIFLSFHTPETRESCASWCSAEEEAYGGAVIAQNQPELHKTTESVYESLGRDLIFS